MEWSDEGFEQVLGAPEGALEEQVAKQTALGRIATAEDVAGVVSFLASEDARTITGQCVCNSPNVYGIR